MAKTNQKRIIAVDSQQCIWIFWLVWPKIAHARRTHVPEADRSGRWPIELYACISASWFFFFSCRRAATPPIFLHLLSATFKIKCSQCRTNVNGIKIEMVQHFENEFITSISVSRFVSSVVVAAATSEEVYDHLADKFMVICFRYNNKKMHSRFENPFRSFASFSCKFRRNSELFFGVRCWVNSSSLLTTDSIILYFSRKKNPICRCIATLRNVCENASDRKTTTFDL